MTGRLYKNDEKRTSGGEGLRFSAHTHTPHRGGAETGEITTVFCLNKETSANVTCLSPAILSRRRLIAKLLIFELPSQSRSQTQLSTFGRAPSALAIAMLIH